MPSLYPYFFFLLLFLTLLLPTSPFPSPLDSNRPRLPPPPTPALTYAYYCIPKRGFFTPVPAYYDCAQAILQLPRPEGRGAFHNGLPDDIFRLPVEKEFESCRVKVELRHQGSTRIAQDWQVVVASALTLAVVCMDPPPRTPKNVFAWTPLDEDERLVVMLEHSRDAVEGLGGGNVTLL